MVIVLGDLGNSPRMQYHALALATTAEVELVGYAGSPLRDEVATHPHIRAHLLPPPAGSGTSGPQLRFFARVAQRIVSQSVRLLWRLAVCRRPDFIVVQNPPAVPTLPIAAIAARVRGATLVIDWHNFGYAMLALRLGAAHGMVRAARWFERVVGRLGNRHFCVSSAMQAELAEHWGIDAVVLYDRPARPAADAANAGRPGHERDGDGWADDGGRRDPAMRSVRIVSPTSWTADEDFSMLLQALECWDELPEPTDPVTRRPNLLVLISGRGPLRAAFEVLLRRRSWRRASVRTLWVAPDEYPRLLAAADLGLCLHRSASGVDLPMKVADMLGAGLPVCAFDYGPCLAEQIHHGENGLLFASARDLARQLDEVLGGFPGAMPLLDRLRHNVAARPLASWSEEWASKAQPVFARRG